MAIVETARLYGRLHSPGRCADGDERLLRRYREGDQTAFAEIVRRHGPLVLGACRRMLSHHQDAEDAFQAAFIVLARKSASIRDCGRLAGWLHAVAVRTSREIRVMRSRRERTVRIVSELPDAPVREPGRGDAELAAVFDQELAKLPDKFRMALIVCEIQGRSRSEAAAALKIPEGTLSSRLAKGRKLLADRLKRRGLAAPIVGVAAIGGLKANPNVSLELLTRTMGGLGGRMFEPAAMAAERVIKAMWISKLQASVFAGVTMIGMSALAAVGLAGEGSGPVKRTTAGIENASADELVDRLGSSRYVHREEAAKQLERIGFSADSALMRGMTHRDPEVQQRSADLRQRIRKAHLQNFRDAFLRDAAAAGQMHHPLWDRFVELVGNDKSSRALFAAILKDERGLARLAEADMHPDRAAKLYVEEVDEQFQALPANRFNWGGQQAGAVQQLALPQQPAQQRLQQTIEQLADHESGHEHAIVFFLGLLAAPAEPFEREIYWQNSDRWHLGKSCRNSDAHAAGRRLYAKWIEHRSAKILKTGLEDAWVEPVAELLPLARRVAADSKRPSTERIAGFSVIARLGGKSDLPLIEPFLDDKTISHLLPGPKREMSHEVRDWARATQLMLNGLDPEQSGFRIDSMMNRTQAPQPGETRWGFEDEASRIAAHENAKIALAKRQSSSK